MLGIHIFIHHLLKIIWNFFIYYRCTSKISAECERKGKSFHILPPILSARLSTKNTFSFQYGKIEIRAKFPNGDWLYPGKY